MAGHWTDLFSFVTGAIRRQDLAYLILSEDKASEQKIPMAAIVQWEPSGWGDGGQVKWRAAGAAIAQHPLEQLLVAGEFGGALLVGSGDRHEERIESAGSNPNDRGPLRGVRRIDKSVYVVGMDRQVYRRDASGAWSSYDTGIPRDPNSEEISGFESIDGFSEHEMFAVGWDGEIWSFLNGVWHAESSPVNTVLVDVCCGGDDLVYACGRNGVLVRGQRGQWEVVDMDGFTESLWSLTWFEGRLYASSMDTVFAFINQQLVPVNMGADRANTCYRLVIGDGVMWSIGAKDVMMFDGHTWTRID
jgi:hypothetical protein